VPRIGQAAGEAAAPVAAYRIGTRPGRFEERAIEAPAGIALDVGHALEREQRRALGIGSVEARERDAVLGEEAFHRRQPVAHAERIAEEVVAVLAEGGLQRV